MRPVAFVLGDSVPMPRAFEQGAATLEQTWPCRVEARLPQYYWIINCRGGRTLTEAPQILKTSVNYYRPQFVVLSAGIVDCVYRALSPRELKLVQRLPGPVAAVIHQATRRGHYRLTKARRMPYTPIEEFRRQFEETARYCEQIKARLLYVPILPAGAHVRKVSFDVEGNIARYNKVATQVLPPTQIVDLSELREDIERFVLPDGHHLNSAGHQYCADRIVDCLQGLGLTGGKTGGHRPPLQ